MLGTTTMGSIATPMVPAIDAPVDSSVLAAIFVSLQDIKKDTPSAADDLKRQQKRHDALANRVEGMAESTNQAIAALQRQVVELRQGSTSIETRLDDGEDFDSFWPRKGRHLSWTVAAHTKRVFFIG